MRGEREGSGAAEPAPDFIEITMTPRDPRVTPKQIATCLRAKEMPMRLVKAVQFFRIMAVLAGALASGVQ